MTEIDRLLAVLRAELLKDVSDAELRNSVDMLERLETMLVAQEDAE